MFALDARALLLRNYDKPSRIFSCMLLIRNHMIFLVRSGINKHLQIFSKTTNCKLTNFVSLGKKIICAYLFQIEIMYLYLITCTKQIDSMLPSVCTITEHRRRQNTIRMSVIHLATPRFDVICDLLRNRSM